MRNHLERYPIALDISDGSELHALQLADRGGNPVVETALRRRNDDGDSCTLPDEAITDFLRHERKAGTFRGRSVSLLAPSGTVLSYPLRVVTNRDETFETALVREAASVLEFPIEEALLDYVSVAEDEEGDSRTHRVLAVAARKQDITRYIDLVRQSGFVLEVVDSVASALYRAHTLATPLGSSPTLLCAMGRSRTDLVVATRDAILAHRYIHWGTGQLTAKLVDNLKLDNPDRDADFLLREHGLSHTLLPDDADPDEGSAISRTVCELLLPLVQECIHEIHNLAGYIRSTMLPMSFNQLYLYGDAIRIKGLCDYLAREVNMNASDIDPVAAHDADAEKRSVAPGDGGAFGLAFGLGLRRVKWL